MSDLWGDTLPCADCKVDVPWQKFYGHLCPESERRLAREIAAAEAHLKKLYAERDRRLIEASLLHGDVP